MMLHSFNIFILSCILFFSKNAMATVNITMPSLHIETPSLPSAYQTLDDIVITEGAVGDFAKGNNKTLTLNLPANFQFDTNFGIVSFASGGDITAASMSINPNSLTITYTVNATKNYDVLTIIGLRIRAVNAATPPFAYITRPTLNGGTGVIAGITSGTPFASLSSCLITAPGNATYNSPNNGATGISQCGAAITWSAPTNTGCNAATSYDVYFGTNPNPPFVTNTTSTSYTTSALTGPTTYYWKIVPRNSNGAATGATIRSFTTSASPCTQCTHRIRLIDLEPYNGYGWYDGCAVNVLVNGAIVLSNLTLSGAIDKEYTFQASNGDVITVEKANANCTSWEDKIEVLGNDNFIVIPESYTTSLPINGTACCSATAAPSCANITSPTNGATDINSCNTKLTWTHPTTDCNGPREYDVYIGTEPGNLHYYATTTSSPYTLPTALNDTTTYYWKLVPKNNAGSATGCGTMSFTTGISPNPNYCLYGDAVNYSAAGENCVQVTEAAQNQSGCIWNRGPISFAEAFDYKINMYFGTDPNGADGCTFIFQNSPQGISTCGINGSQLGAGGIENSVIIEFDTYDNDGIDNNDIEEHHVAVEIDGDLPDDASYYPPNEPPLCGPVQANPTSPYLTDGATHEIRVTWDPVSQTLEVYVDGSLRLSCQHDYINNVFGGNSNVWWGFSGATGGFFNQHYFCPVSIPLPIEMMEFNAICNGNSPLLTWYTSSETNNSHFIVERSVNGSDFESIAKVMGAGNSNKIIKYQFIDNDVKNINTNDLYYRLKQFDLDGKNTELGIVSTNKCVENILEITSINKVYSNQCVINFNTNIEGLHNVSIFDINGKLIENMNINCQEGLNQVDFCTNIENGIYLIRISNSFNSVSQKFKH